MTLNYGFNIIKREQKYKTDLGLFQANFISDNDMKLSIRLVPYGTNQLEDLLIPIKHGNIDRDDDHLYSLTLYRNRKDYIIKAKRTEVVAEIFGWSFR